MTREEIIQAISDDKTMPYIQPEQLAGIVDFVIKNYNSFLDTLAKQTASEGLEEEYKKWWESITGRINIEHCMEWYMHETAHHFAEWGAEHLCGSTKMLPDGLEEAKEVYCNEHNDDCIDAIGDTCPHIRNAFIAGAEWMKAKMLEWLNERYKSTISNVGCYTGHSVWAEVIEKLESM